MTDKLFLIAPSADDLATALGVLDGTTPSLASDAAYASATASLPADRLGEVYAGPAYYQAFDAMMTNIYSMPMGGNAPSAQVMQCLQVTLIDPANASSVAALVAGPDNISVQSNVTNAFSLPVVTSTDLATHVPASSLLYLQVPNVGPSVHDLVSCLRTSVPEVFSDKNVQQLEQALGNPLEDEFSFIGDLALTVGFAALGAYVGRNLSGGTGLILFIGAFACIFGLQFANARGREQLKPSMAQRAKHYFRRPPRDCFGAAFVIVT